MPRLMCAAVDLGDCSVTLTSKTIARSYCAASSMRIASSYSARTSTGTGASCVIVTPFASLTKSGSAAGGGGGGGRFVFADLAVAVRSASGTQPRARNSASKGIVPQIALSDRILLRIGILHRSLFHHAWVHYS